MFNQYGAKEERKQGNDDKKIREILLLFEEDGD